ncbi:MAG TPA: hypothetical protein EYP85_04740, partial [Armatimonadetes bacterium]|nr:hypothetical protein [Armatimonadota bacterium]
MPYPPLSARGGRKGGPRKQGEWEGREVRAEQLRSNNYIAESSIPPSGVVTAERRKAMKEKRASPAIEEVFKALMDLAIREDASDIHFSVGEPPILRIYGHLRRLHQFGVLKPEHTMAIAKLIAPERNLQELGERMGTDLGFSYGDKARFRVSIFKQKYNVGIVMRLIPYKLLTFEEIGLPEQVKRLLHLPRGLILVTGPTGCGKTTTLATMIDYINTHRDCHIITVEDPIEYYHTGKKSIITQRE